MKLHYVYYPAQNVSAVTIVILHGLFGSSKNWTTVAKELAKFYNVYAIDARNHGNSPHAPTHTLQDMIEDLEEFLKDQGISMPVLLGHSMGGLVAMGYALLNPESVKSIIVVDIAPKSYPRQHHREFEVLKTDVSHFSSRKEIDEYLARIHPDPAIRQFLMMNLERQDHFYWKINVSPLEKGDYLEEFHKFQGLVFGKKCLFLRATESRYILQEDYTLIQKYFPLATIKELQGNHWLHYTNQKGFLDAVFLFLQEIS